MICTDFHPGKHTSEVYQWHLNSKKKTRQSDVNFSFEVNQDVIILLQIQAQTGFDVSVQVENSVQTV